MFSQNTYRTTYQQCCTIIVLLFLTILGLSACRPKEVELPFENIELYQYSLKYERKEPGLMIITSAEEANEAGGWVTVDALEQLQEMDYETHFAIIAFLGRQPTGHEGIRIERIVRMNNNVSIFAQIGRRLGDDVVTSPYHLVKVTRTGHWDTTITFNLIASGATVATKSQRVP